MVFRPRILLLIFGTLGAWSSLARSESVPDQGEASAQFFEARIRPILVGHCYGCHSAETKPAGGLRVDDPNGLLTGGDNGAAVVPGDPDASLLIRRVSHQDPRQRMPREGDPLSTEEIADLSAWIRNGARWPALKVSASISRPKEGYEPLRREHWAWQPLTEPELPAVRDSSWPRDDLDRFIRSGLEKAALEPVADADRTTLLRRVTFDLTGLPPSPAELDAFLSDGEPDAFARVVDRLLGSPHFGERWGRHWLDVARYAESTGPSRNIPYPHAWRYRDYIIDAVNADVPFDRFVVEQIAGDLLPAETDAERDRLRIATGFLALGVKDVNQRFKVRFEMDNVDDQIDVVSRSILGLTVTCARCHDHKFDPIPTADYYALAGILTSTENAAGLRNKMGGSGLDYYDPAMLVTLSGTPSPPPEAQLHELEAKVAAAKKAWDKIRGTPEGLSKGPDGRPRQRQFRLEYDRLKGEHLALTDPAARGHAVHGVRDAKAPADTAIRLRGEAEKLGPVVPRGFLTAFNVPGASSSIDPAGSGRRELAHWLTGPRNPLTPRVFVNRVWFHLFGRGIVATVDNFGTSGDLPSNPALLDHLASRLIREGWSLKRLVRAIVLSRTYQLGSEATPVHLAADPANALLWRHSPRRLDAEEIRDAVLLTAGSLQPTRPVGSPVQTLKMIEIRDNGPEARKIRDLAASSSFRSVYLPLMRGVTPRSLEAFDPVDQTLVTGRRESTTVPAQALFLLNSSFVRRQSLALAGRLLEGDATQKDRIRLAYRLALGRSPTDTELERASTFLTEFEAARLAWEHEVSAETSDPTPASAPASAAAPLEVAQKADERPATANPDDVDQTGEPEVEENVQPGSAQEAAWLAFVQALFGSAEFRYIR
jgi:cytochrome c553